MQHYERLLVHDRMNTDTVARQPLTLRGEEEGVLTWGEHAVFTLLELGVSGNSHCGKTLFDVQVTSHPKAMLAILQGPS